MRRTIVVSLGGLCASILTATASAASITSADFSLDYGATFKSSGQNAWTTTETAGTNSPTTQGSFTFSPAPIGSAGSDTGPVFPAGVLGNGSGTSVVGFLGGAFSPTFSVPITASYNGAAPIDAAAIPNYRIMIEITSISIYAVRNSGGLTTQWNETTPGHAQSSSTINLQTTTGGNPLSTASIYTLLSWNPDDYDVVLGSLNGSSVRTFSIPADDGHFADGLSIEGRIHLIYDAVPEPASLGLLALGGLALLGRGRR